MTDLRITCPACMSLIRFHKIWMKKTSNNLWEPIKEGGLKPDGKAISFHKKCAQGILRKQGITQDL
jgi:hypothetical protein